MSNPLFLHPDEAARMSALRSIQILETPIEERFERITRLARKAFNVPISAVSCVDSHRQWFKSIQGLNVVETDRCISFCQHTILQHEPLVVNDARFDDRFSSNPLVCDDPGIVFYAGTPIFSQDHLPIASFCVIDTRPRSFDDDDIEMLADFAKMVEYEIHASAPNPVHQQLVEQVGESWRTSLVDPLTRLWNHEGIRTILNEALSHRGNTSDGLCVAKINLASFTEINNTLGYVAGDDILRSFAKSLLMEIGVKNILGRIHGDEFAIVMNPVSEMNQAVAALSRMQSFVNHFPIEGIEGRENLGGSIAAVLVPGQGRCTLELVLEQLDEAMYLAKKSKDPHPSIVRARMSPGRTDQQPSESVA